MPTGKTQNINNIVNGINILELLVLYLIQFSRHYENISLEKNLLG